MSVHYQHGQNQSGYKKNDSIAELNKTSAQMLKILKELGITVETVIDDFEDI